MLPSIVCDLLFLVNTAWNGLLLVLLFKFASDVVLDRDLFSLVNAICIFGICSGWDGLESKSLSVLERRLKYLPWWPASTHLFVGLPSGIYLLSFSWKQKWRIHDTLLTDKHTYILTQQNREQQLKYFSSLFFIAPCKHI